MRSTLGLPAIVVATGVCAPALRRIASWPANCSRQPRAPHVHGGPRYRAARGPSQAGQRNVGPRDRKTFIRRRLQGPPAEPRSPVDRLSGAALPLVFRQHHPLTYVAMQVDDAGGDVVDVDLDP